MGKEQLKENTEENQEITETIETTRKGLFGLNLDIIKKYFQKALGKIKDFFGFSKDKKGEKFPETEGDIEGQIGGSTISNEMFQQLLNMEGKQNFTAKIHGKIFGEKFVTGPYGMVYKHIDKNGKLLKHPTTFQNGEKVSPSWAEQNARAYYNKRAKKRKDILDNKGCKYNQNMLDALVSASGGTTKSFNYLKDYVITHWDNKNAIYNFRTKFATTAAGNGKVMPGLLRRRKFEANWFKGIRKPFSSYHVR